LQDADRSVVENEFKLRKLQLRRIDAELSGVPVTRQVDDSPELLAQVDAQYRARRQSYLDSLGSEQALLAKAQHDLQVAKEVQDKLRKTVPIYREQAQGWDQLAREGFAGKLMVLERQRLYIENEQDLRAQAHNIASLRAIVAQSEQRLAQITSGYRQQLQNERIEADAHRHRLQQELDKQQHRSSLLELRAPQTGVVKDLATYTSGTVVAPGTILLTLVPKDEPLIAEVWVNNSDAGFVRLDQKTRVKLAAYPFQKYGMLEGRIQHIGADAQERTGDTATAKPVRDAAYRALVNLETAFLESQGERLALVPGMLVMAEIHLGTRTVLEYFLSPVQKIVREAARER
jgi:HlyD family secretion protein